MNSMQENLLILFLLLPCMLSTWWGFVYLVNHAMGFKLKEVYETIYSDPLAAAVLRVGVMGTIAYLVNGAFGRLV